MHTEHKVKKLLGDTCIDNFLMCNLTKYLTLACVIAPLASHAEDVPLTYTNPQGRQTPVTMVTGVNSDGVPVVSQYVGPDGKEWTPVVTANICAIVNGVPQYCPTSTDTENDTPGLVVGSDDIVTKNGNWPSTDPLVSGEVWINGGVAMVSTGAKAKPTFDTSATTVTVGSSTNNLATWIADTNSEYTTLSNSLASYLTTSTAQATYAPIDSPTLTGSPKAPTPATTDNSTAIATTSFVNSAFASIDGSVTGDVSQPGSSITLVFPGTNVKAVFAYTGSGSASMTFYATAGTVSPVDIRRNSIWGGSGVETFTLDNGSLTTSGTVADSTVYTQSNDSSAYFVRINGTVFIMTVWSSANGARSFIGWHKMI